MRTHILISSALGAVLASPTAWGQTPQPEAFRARHVTLQLSIDYPAQKLSGSMTYDLENWTAQPAREVSFLLGRLMEASNVLDSNGTPVPYTQDVRRAQDDPK
jgi:hypothetical protein